MRGMSSSDELESSSYTSTSFASEFESAALGVSVGLGSADLARTMKHQSLPLSLGERGRGLGEEEIGVESEAQDVL